MTESEPITRENLVRAFYGGYYKTRFSAVSAGYSYASNYPEHVDELIELFATQTSKSAAVRTLKGLFDVTFQIAADTHADQKTQAMNSILAVLSGKGRFSDISFGIQFGFALRLDQERARNIVTEMLVTLPNFRGTEAAATGWAAMRCLNIIANDIARSGNPHNISWLCDKLLDACDSMKSWRFREHAICCIDTIGTYSSGDVVPLGRLRKMAEEAKDSSTWSRAVVCIAHQILNRPAGEAAIEYAPILINALKTRKEQFKSWRQRDAENVYHQVGVALKQVLTYHTQSPQIASELIPAVIHLFLDANLRGSRFEYAVRPLVDAFDYAVKIKGITVNARTLSTARKLRARLESVSPVAHFRASAEDLVVAIHLLSKKCGPQKDGILSTPSVELRRRGPRDGQTGARGTLTSG
ncbi:MAG: hypothetical protein AABW86_05435 [Candidatus Micrarchaeota archaeon]